MVQKITKKTDKKEKSVKDKNSKLKNKTTKKKASGKKQKTKLNKKVKKVRKQILRGRASIKCSYNNTIVSLSDLSGNVLAWATSGLMGFKGAKKATPYAATQVVANVSEKVKKYGLKDLEVFVKGVGSGREASVRALANNGFNLILIKDTTPIPHNGCRPKKSRRL